MRLEQVAITWTVDDVVLLINLRDSFEALISLFLKAQRFVISLEKMSDDGYCGDAGYNDTGDCYNDTGGGWCDDSAPCMDTAPCEMITTFAETSFSHGGGFCVDQPFEVCDGGYCYEDTVYQPVYSPLSTSNGDGVSCACACAIILGFIIVFIIMCKLNYVVFKLLDVKNFGLNFNYFQFLYFFRCWGLHVGLWKVAVLNMKFLIDTCD